MCWNLRDRVKFYIYPDVEIIAIITNIIFCESFCCQNQASLFVGENVRSESRCALVKRVSQLKEQQLVYNYTLYRYCTSTAV
jgi:hypothetical protein